MSVIFPGELAIPYRLDYDNAIVGVLLSDGTGIYFSDDNLTTVNNYYDGSPGTANDVTNNELAALGDYRIGVDVSGLTAEQQASVQANPYQLFETAATKRDEYCISLTTSSEQISLPFVGAFTGTITLEDGTEQAISGSGTYVIEGTAPKKIKSISATDTANNYLWIFDRKDNPSTIADEYNGAIATLVGSPTFERVIPLFEYSVGTGKDYTTGIAAAVSAVNTLAGHHKLVMYDNEDYGTTTPPVIHPNGCDVLEITATPSKYFDGDLSKNPITLTANNSTHTIKVDSKPDALFLLSGLNIINTGTGAAQLKHWTIGGEILWRNMAFKSVSNRAAVSVYNSADSSKVTYINSLAYDSGASGFLSNHKNTTYINCVSRNNAKSGGGGDAWESGFRSVAGTTLINCVSLGSTKYADYFGGDFSYCVSSDSTAGTSNHNQSNVTITLDANGLLDQTTQDTYLKGKGWNGSDIASAFYAVQLGEILSIDSGLYVVSGDAVGLKAAYNLLAQAESFTLVGTALGLAKGSALIAEPGSYTLSGAELQVRSAYRNLLENGAFDLTGTDVTLIYTPVTPSESIVLESGSFELIGTSAALTAKQKIPIEAGDYSLSGTDLNLVSGSSISLDVGDYSLNGSDIALVTSYGIILQTGDYVLNGTSVTLKYSGDSAQAIGNVTAAFAESTVSVGYRPTEITVKFKES